MDIYKNLIKPLLFQLDPETSHDLAKKSLKFLDRFSISNNFCYQPKFRRKVMGIDFPNPVGLAAGFDKNAELLDYYYMLGFGFVEVGSVTPNPQSGNPKPRVFRFTKEGALLNFMGLNNDGLVQINKRLENRKSTDIKVGVNIGKNRDTELNLAYKDYVLCVKEMYNNVDYFTLNISSPNTYGMRNLLDVDPLKVILENVQNQNHKNSIIRPMVVKISPDMTYEKIDAVLETCKDFKINGLISTNTTVRHDYFKGGLSGKPLKAKSEEILFYIKNKMNNRLSVISSGGIMDKSDAIKRLNMGADLIQLYTGLVYEGPNLPRNILKSYAESQIQSV